MNNTPSLFQPFNGPLACTFQQLEQTLSLLSTMDAATAKQLWADFGNRKTEERPYEITNGMAVHSLSGLLVQHPTWWLRWVGGTSTQEFSEQATRADNDPDVTEHKIIVSSGGGEVYGTPEAAEVVHTLKKPCHVVSSSVYASAALYIAIAATGGIWVTSKAVTGGSIGVKGAPHFNWQKFYENLGIEVDDSFYLGELKHASPYGPISEAMKAERKALLASLMDMFVKDVARFSGLDEAAIIAQKSGVFVGDDLIAQGLARGLVADRQPSTSGPEHEEVLTVSNKENATSAATVDRAYLDANHSDLVQQIKDEGAQAQLDRVSGILAVSAPEDKKLAAINSGLTVAQAEAVLGGTLSTTAPAAKKEDATADYSEKAGALLKETVAAAPEPLPASTTEKGAAASFPEGMDASPEARKAWAAWCAMSDTDKADYGGTGTDAFELYLTEQEADDE